MSSSACLKAGWPERCLSASCRRHAGLPWRPWLLGFSDGQSRPAQRRASRATGRASGRAPRRHCPMRLGPGCDSSTSFPFVPIAIVPRKILARPCQEPTVGGHSESLGSMSHCAIKTRELDHPCNHGRCQCRRRRPSDPRLGNSTPLETMHLSFLDSSSGPCCWLPMRDLLGQGPVKMSGCAAMLSFSTRPVRSHW